jgi:hypothetical protein
LINIHINWLLTAQRSYLAWEDEIRGIYGAENDEKEFGLRSFIPVAVTDTDQYWHVVTEKCFALSTRMGAPTFFLTFIMNPYWPDYHALKSGSWPCSDATMISIVFRSCLKFIMKYCKSTRILGRGKAFVWRVEYEQRYLPHAHILFGTDSDTNAIHEMDRLINARNPDASSFYHEQEMINDFRALIYQFQIHHHSRRCRKSNGVCKYGYPKAGIAQSRIQQF